MYQYPSPFQTPVNCLIVISKEFRNVLGFGVKERVDYVVYGFRDLKMVHVRSSCNDGFDVV